MCQHNRHLFASKKSASLITCMICCQPLCTLQSVRKAKQERSDDDEAEEDLEPDKLGAKTGANSGPAQLVCLEATPCVAREQELCNVCGSGDGWDG